MSDKGFAGRLPSRKWSEFNDYVKDDLYRNLYRVVSRMSSMLAKVKGQAPGQVVSTTPSCFPKNAFHETEPPFLFLSRALTHCRELGLESQGQQLVQAFYHAACAEQLADVGVADGEAGSRLAKRLHKGHILYELAMSSKRRGFEWCYRYYLALALAEDILTHFFLHKQGDEFLNLLKSIDFDKLSLASSSSVKGDDEAWKVLQDIGRNLEHPPFGEKWDAAGAPANEALAVVVCRFWLKTGVCNSLRDDFGMNLAQVMRFVKMVAVHVFNADATDEDLDRGQKKTLLGYQENGSYPFAVNSNWKKYGWAETWLAFPEWVCSKSGLFNEILGPFTPLEADCRPFNSVYYGLLCQVLCRSDEKEESSKNDLKGLVFEELVAHVLQSVPGVRVARGVNSDIGELDVIGYIPAECRVLNTVRSGVFIAECKWSKDGVGVSVVDALITRAARVGATAAMVFSKRGVCGRDSGKQSDLVIRLESMTGIAMSSLSQGDLHIERASEALASVLKEMSDPSFDLGRFESLVSLNTPSMLRAAFDRHRFGIYSIAGTGNRGGVDEGS